MCKTSSITLVLTGTIIFILKINGLTCVELLSNMVLHVGKTVWLDGFLRVVPLVVNKSYILCMSMFHFFKKLNGHFDRRNGF